MIIERSMHSEYLSNSWLVAGSPGTSAIFIDAGGPIEPLLQAVAENDLHVTHLFNTHDHADHTLHNVALQERFDVPLLGPDSLDDGLLVQTGELTVRAVATPGHTPEHYAFIVNDTACFTGDVLFAGSVGGTLSGGPDSFAQLRHSVMEVLLRLPADTRLYPGHCAPTTVGDELERNPFVRMWRGADSPDDTPVKVAGREAVLKLWADDYDGGKKGWVGFPDGTQAVVGGSRVEFAATRL